ncbi:MAG: chromosome segregation protein SMC, partial [Gammaproteobacteria bacterium]
MRLKRIKLAGFKSFVEPTSVSLPHDLIGVVGPNGCGKSNIIDAVRWVMGEISAKLLRGDSMEDVIFNGSSSRKPVGKAFVELIFDNTSERVKGPYAKYSEINVRREVSRDGQSKYFLNKSRVRRRDVMDLFLGTGLGPRSYSIIEQGMVNRIVESKPEELRLFVEEAAGISKYKERRRETENRIKHTRENLSRVEDIRQELDKQLQRLKRQSKTAERYKQLKQKERELKAQLAAIRWLEIGEQLEEHDKELAQLETALQAAIARQREKETLIEEIRQQQGESTEQFNTVQAEFYDISANVARLEQTIKHEREKLEDRQRQQEGLESTIASIQAHIQSDTSSIQNYTSMLETHEQSRDDAGRQLDQVKQSLQSLETRLQETVAKLETLEHEAATRQREKEVQQVRIREIESRLERRGKSEMRLGAEFQQLSERVQASGLDALREQLSAAQAQHDASKAGLDACQENISRTREQLADINEQLSALREKKQALSGRLESLVEVQGAESDSQSLAWAEQQNLGEDDRLYRQLKVEPGWEAAVDAVLGRAMQAFCTDRLTALLQKVADTSTSLALFQTGLHQPASNDTLLARVIDSPVDLQPILLGVYAASTTAEALERTARLNPGESVVTPDGVQIGPNWTVLTGGAADSGSVLA